MLIMQYDDRRVLCLISVSLAARLCDRPVAATARCCISSYHCRLPYTRAHEFSGRSWKHPPCQYLAFYQVTLLRNRFTFYVRLVKTQTRRFRESCPAQELRVAAQDPIHLPRLLPHSSSAYRYRPRNGTLAAQDGPSQEVAQVRHAAAVFLLSAWLLPWPLSSHGSREAVHD